MPLESLLGAYMEMQTLDWYLKNAENAIRKFAGGTRFIKDEDAIAFVARFMMDADVKYDGKTGSREGFRWKYAEYAVKILFTKSKKKKKMVSINVDRGNDGFRFDQTLTKDAIPTNSNNNVIPDVIHLVNTATYLSDKERDCVRAKFIDSKNYQEIANTLGITRERVRQVVEKALYKIRKNCECNSKNGVSVL